MQNRKFRTALEKTSSVLSLIFMVGIASTLIGFFSGNIISTALGFFSSPAIFWDYGFAKTSFICGLLVAGISTVLILRGTQSRLKLKKIGARHEILLCMLILMLSSALAYIPNFTASSQSSFFVTLGMKTLMISLCAIGMTLIMRGELKINFTNARMEAREEGISGEFIEMQGDDQPAGDKESMLGQLIRLLVLTPICLWMLSLTFTFQLKSNLTQPNGSIEVKNGSCSQYRNACALRSVFLYLEDARSFEEEKTRISEVLALLPKIDLSCPNAADDISFAMMALTGKQLLPENILLTALSVDEYHAPKILSGEGMQTDVYVLHTRLRIALAYYNAAVASQLNCRPQLGPDFKQAMTI